MKGFVSQNSWAENLSADVEGPSALREGGFVPSTTAEKKYYNITNNTRNDLLFKPFAWFFLNVHSKRVDLNFRALTAQMKQK